MPSTREATLAALHARLLTVPATTLRGEVLSERVPAAVWQHQGELTLIDAEGVLLDPVERDAIPDLPLVIGPGADKQEPMYQRLLAAAPALKPRVAAATWVGNRRWDLRFDSGETLKLPEEGAEAALPLGPLLGWMDRVAALGHGARRDMPADEALDIARASEPRDPGVPADGDPSVLRAGQDVVVQADDRGRDPVRGTLVAADAQEAVVMHRNDRVGVVHIHFPRAGFDVQPA